MSSGMSRYILEVCDRMSRGYAGNPDQASASWEDCGELNELEVAERVRVAQIGDVFEVSRHVSELATAHNVLRKKEYGILPKPHKKP